MFRFNIQSTQKYLIRSLVLCLVLWSALPLASAQGIAIKIARDKTYDDSIFSVGQKVIVEGTVNGDVGVVMEDLHIKGTIKGNITALNGSVRFYRGAKVEGNLVCLGGEVDLPDPTIMTGKIVHHFAPSQTTPSNFNLTGLNSMAALFFAQTFFLFLLVVITFYIFPNQINEASFQVTQDPVRHAIIGVTTMVSFLLGLFVSILLMVVMVGFPLFLLLFSGLMIVCIFGAVVVFHRIGQYLENLSKGALSMVISLLLSVIVVGLLLHLPVIGTLVKLGFLVFGTGVVIETRFGTNKQWFTKKKRYWAAG